ncbi:MAG TPA: alpha/beta hydrolase [Mucilaginibacter sp.]
MKKVKTDLLEMAYLEAGENNDNVVLLIHGWPDDATTWTAVMSSLVNAGFRAIAPFSRGFGETRFLNKDTPRTGNPGRLAMDLIALLNALNIDNFQVVGHDWGSNAAEALAVGWPERVKKMAQLSTPSRLGGLPTPPFKHAQLEWYHWFQATKRGAAAVRKDPVGFAKIMWDNWSPKS